MIRKAPSILLASIVAWSGPALAQTPSTLPEWSYSAGVLLRAYMDPQVPTWSNFAGLSLKYGPRYDGSRDYHFVGGPTLELRYRDIAFFSTGEGLGVNLLHGKNYRAGLALTYDLGRRARDSADTHGLGNVNMAPELKAFGEYLIFPVVMRADVRRALGGHDGWIADLSAYAPVYGNEKFFVLFGPDVTFADDRYMRHYFGIDAAQSARSRYPTYVAHAGLNSAGFGTSITWLATDHWLVNMLGGLHRALGDAADSPINQRITQSTGVLTVGYQF